MNIYVHEKGVLLTGKAWEIRQKLNEYGKCYEYVADWVGAQSKDASNVSYHKPSLIMNPQQKEFRPTSSKKR
ncbi:Z-ring formation inhibitor MciZ [Niallia sp. XMNu-256]|uniref:Z-ring formation inhibitor MciZ n=1 Tax=Niallia sp. XMNu-256 TaxID=3082444 RepID=UPI0030D13768